MHTNEVIKKYNISRQTLYEWRKQGKLEIEKDWNGYLIWNDKSILTLEHILNEEKKKNTMKTKKIKEIEIQNRRYLGAKTKLLPFIKKIIEEHTDDIHSVADIFGGTGVVSDMFAMMGKEIIINDLLHSNYQIYNAFFGTEKYNKKLIQKVINKFNTFNGNYDGYVTNIYGDRYFSKENASKIDQARDYLEEISCDLNSREYSILLSVILYAADKVANTVGHYDAYRKTMNSIQPIQFVPLKINNYKNTLIYNEDANLLVKQIYADLIYIDTPYNSRQYVDTYHVLENITDWNKPSVSGIAMKSNDRSDRRSKYNLVSAPQAFDDLIQNINSKYILVSFNNMAKKGSGRSNSKISHEEIIDSLSKKGEVEVFTYDYMPYNTGKTNIDNHKELLYFVEVDRV